MKKSIHTSLTIWITVLALMIAFGNAAAINMRWVTALYWLLISVRISMEIPRKRKS